MKLAETFRRLGIGGKAGVVYETLSKSSHPLLVAHIARRAKITRQEVYRALGVLQDAGFVMRQQEGKRTVYRAMSPHRIEEAFVATAHDVAELLGKHAIKEAPAHVTFYSGFSGIRAVFDDVINHTPRGSTFYRYTSERDLAKVNQYLSPAYRAQRDAKKLERLVISNALSGSQKRPRLERFIKYMPSQTTDFNQNAIQLIYGKRVAFINLSTEEAFIIEDPILAAFQKAIFTHLYRKL